MPPKPTKAEELELKNFQKLAIDRNFGEEDYRRQMDIWVQKFPSFITGPDVLCPESLSFAQINALTGISYPSLRNYLVRAPEGKKYIHIADSMRSQRSAKRYMYSVLKYVLDRREQGMMKRGKGGNKYKDRMVLKPQQALTNCVLPEFREQEELVEIPDESGIGV